MCEQAKGDRVWMELDMRSDLKWFAGHFPGRPVLPGVVQIAWGVHYSRIYFGYGPELRAMEQIKFKKPILPGQKLTLALFHQCSDITVDFEYLDVNNSYASGILRFMVHP